MNDAAKIENPMNYFVVFPSYLLEHLNHRQCVLFGVINSLANKRGYCYATNKTLVKMVNTSNKSLERDLKVLEGRKLIFRELIHDSNKRVVERRITPFNGTPQFGVYLPSSLGDSPTDQSGGGNSNTINNDKKTKPYSVEFERGWEAYLKKGVKKTAYKAWQRLTSNQQRDALAHIPLFVTHHQARHKRMYLPHFATYLNQHRWENDLPYEEQNNSDIQWN